MRLWYRLWRSSPRLVFWSDRRFSDVYLVGGGVRVIVTLCKNLFWKEFVTVKKLVLRVAFDLKSFFFYLPILGLFAYGPIMCFNCIGFRPLFIFVQRIFSCWDEEAVYRISWAFICVLKMTQKQARAGYPVDLPTLMASQNKTDVSAFRQNSCHVLW